MVVSFGKMPHVFVIFIGIVLSVGKRIYAHYTDMGTESQVSFHLKKILIRNAIGF